MVQPQSLRGVEVRVAAPAIQDLYRGIVRTQLATIKMEGRETAAGVLRGIADGLHDVPSVRDEKSQTPALAKA